MKGIKTILAVTAIIVVTLLTTNYFITKEENKGRLAHLREIVAEEALGTKEQIILGLKDLNNKKNESDKDSRSYMNSDGIYVGTMDNIGVFIALRNGKPVHWRATDSYSASGEPLEGITEYYGNLCHGVYHTRYLTW